ncbi:hypothetical protein M8J75_004293 [Diaphorina citri]|nr:hypothetical protein M8J75_004293 [Diaphorina citri]
MTSPVPFRKIEINFFSEFDGKLLLAVGGEEEKPKGPLIVYSFVTSTNSTEDKVNYKEQQTVLRKALQAHIPKGLLLETREKGGLQYP